MRLSEDRFRLDTTALIDIRIDSCGEVLSSETRQIILKAGRSNLRLNQWIES